MPSRRAVLGLVAAVPLLSLARPALAASEEVFADSGIAIHGADPVAYFREGGPVAGSAAHRLMWRGAVWHFATAANLASFEADPARFAPRYGGYCAYALAQGALAPTVPDAWTIHDGRLYLNYSLGVRSLWQADIPGHIAAANGYWPQILG